VKASGVTAQNARADNCGFSSAEFALEWVGGEESSVAVNVRLGALFPEGAYDNVARGLFEDFRVAVERLELEKGCLAPGGSRKVAERVAESLPLPLMDVIYYRGGYDVWKGYVELRPGVRLVQQAVAEKRDRDSKVDVQTATFDVVAAERGSSVRVVRSQEGGAADLIIDLASPNAAPGRLFLHVTFVGQPSNIPERAAVLMRASDLGLLKQGSESLWKDAWAACSGHVNEKPAECTVIPSRAVVGPEFRVILNGKPSYVTVGTSVNAILSKQKGFNRRKYLARLKVERMYAGRPLRVLPRNKTDETILGLPLAPDDRLSW